MCGDGGGGRARCALCGVAADVHCAADNAFLCCACDAEAHGANLVAARHPRTRVSAPVPVPVPASSCVSTARSPTPTRPRGEAVMEGWATRMGVAAWAARRCAAAAWRALRAEVAPPRTPLRVAMAAALWREVAPHCAGVHEHRAADAIRRLEASAHVPARVVVAVGSSMARSRARNRTIIFRVIFK